MSDRPLHELSVVEMVDAQRDGVTDAVELLDASAARIAAVEDRVAAVITLDLEGARAAAEESAARWRSGTARPLEGVPFGVKDVIATAGVRTSLGSARFSDWIPTESAVSVARLQDAGSVMVAKLATPEWSYGDARDEHKALNPWNPLHWTGGSSSGPGAAVAARELPLSLGTDTTGSIRVPSSYCGVSGLMGTSERVPRTGVVPVSWTLDHTGPMARSARDLDLAFAVLTDGPRPSSTDTPSVDGLRIGVPRTWFYENIDDEQLAATESALAEFEAAGATLVDVAIPSAELAGALAYVISFAEFAAEHADAHEHIDDYTKSAIDRVVLGDAITAPEYIQAMRLRTRVQGDLDRVFAACDVMITPATPTVAPAVAPTPHPLFTMGHEMWLDWVAKNFLVFNVTGAPAAVIPTGFTSDGLPTAMQIAAAPQHDEQILRAAIAFQDRTDHHTVLPPL